MPKRSMIPLAVLAWSVTLILLAPAVAAQPVEVVYAKNRLSVQADGAPLGRLLDLVGRQTGVRFHFGQAAAGRPVNASFRGLDLARGLERLLAGHNTMIMLDKAGRPIDVYVLGQGAVVGPGGAPGQPGQVQEAMPPGVAPPPVMSEPLPLPEAPPVDDVPADEARP